MVWNVWCWVGVGVSDYTGEERQEGLWNRRCGRAMGEEMERHLSAWICGRDHAKNMRFYLMRRDKV